jgi:hypothetical protein
MQSGGTTTPALGVIDGLGEDVGVPPEFEDAVRTFGERNADPTAPPIRKTEYPRTTRTVRATSRRS